MLLRRAMLPPETVTLSPHLPIAGTMLTHPGCVRELNEDFVAFTLPSDNDAGVSRGMLALVADGMGGHAAGEVASRIAGETVLRLYHEMAGSPVAVLQACLAAANTAIINQSRSDPSCAGMGTTCTVLAVRDGEFFLAHIGDSRAYLLRDGELHQISDDHSLVAEMVREGKLSKAEAARSPERNVILRALGMEAPLARLVWREGAPVRAGDVFILCSDGLTDLVDEYTIHETASRLLPFEACQALLETALAAGGTDNISVGVFLVGELPPRLPQAARTTRPLSIGGASP